MNLRHNNRGFSLMEILIATMILGFALAGLVHGVTTAMQSNKDSELLASASLLAAGQIELLRSESFISTGSSEGEGAGPMSLYTWTQTVSRGELDGLFDVEVVVSHAKTGEMLYQLKTKLFDPPLSKDAPGGAREEKRKRGQSGASRTRR